MQKRRPQLFKILIRRCVVSALLNLHRNPRVSLCTFFHSFFFYLSLKPIKLKVIFFLYFKGFAKRNPILVENIPSKELDGSFIKSNIALYGRPVRYTRSERQFSCLSCRQLHQFRSSVFIQPDGVLDFMFIWS